MQLIEATNRGGLVDRVYYWTRRPYPTDGASTDNELRDIINGLNRSFDDIMPLLLAWNDQMRWDDINHTDAPVATVNLVANQNDYKITTDDNSLDVLEIIYVRILLSSGDTKYHDLERIDTNDSRVPEILSPDTAVTGRPGGYLALGNRLYLDTLPDSSITNGIEIGFSRQQSYFSIPATYADNTAEPGIPLPFHELLALYTALDWVSVKRTDDGNLLNILRGKIDRKEQDLRDMIEQRNPSRTVLSNEIVRHD
jgi:hypothetical protein